MGIVEIIKAAFAKGEWNEDLHPREAGRFASGGGGGAAPKESGSASREKMEDIAWQKIPDDKKAVRNGERVVLTPGPPGIMGTPSTIERPLAALSDKDLQNMSGGSVRDGGAAPKAPEPPGAYEAEPYTPSTRVRSTGPDEPIKPDEERDEIDRAVDHAMRESGRGRLDGKTSFAFAEAYQDKFPEGGATPREMQVFAREFVGGMKKSAKKSWSWFA